MVSLVFIRARALGKQLFIRTRRLGGEFVTRRPLDGVRRVTGDRASHAKYGVGAATDYGADSGEAVRAPFTGWVTRWWSNTGGNSVAITSDEYKFSGQHLSAYAGASSGQIQEGSVIGYVGNTGSATTGPHFHSWIIRLSDGCRLAFEEFLSALGWKNTAGEGGTVPGAFQTSTAGSEYTPIFDGKENEEEEMTAIRIRDASNGSIAWATIGTGHFWELPNPDYEALLNGWNLWDRSKDMDVPSNLYGFLKGVAVQNRGSVDSKAVAAAVVTSMPLGQIDPTVLGAAIEAALGDDFAAIPASVIAALKNAL
jgi:murein DD-endopeptidase MepM/ murein hydrolase activator NlpD